MHPSGGGFGRSLSRQIKTLLTLGAALLSLGAMLWAQRPTGEIRLEVKDPSGAPMQVSGTLENLADGTSRKFETSPQGAYTAESVPYGRYRVQLSQTGFAAQTVMIDVQSASPTTRSVIMALSGTAETVEVVAISLTTVS